MNVAIVGSRAFPDPHRVTAFVRNLATKYPDAVVVSGGAKGVDSWAVSTAQIVGLGTAEFCVVKQSSLTYTHRLRTNDRAKELLDAETLALWADWCDAEYDALSEKCSAFANAAYARNTWIVKASDQVVAFWDGQSRGTQNTRREAKRLNKPLHTFQ